MTLLEKAGIFLQRSDWRSALASYKQAFELGLEHLNQPNWLDMQVNCMSGYTSIFKEDKTRTATAEDLTFMICVYKSPSSSTPVKMFVLYCLGIIMFDHRDREKSASYYRKGLQAYAQVTPAEFQSKIWLQYMPEGFTESGPIMRDLMFNIDENLAVLEVRPPLPKNTPFSQAYHVRKTLDKDGGYSEQNSITCRTIISAIAPENGTTGTSSFPVGHQACAMKCGAKAASPGVELMKCARCLRVSYCSTACQRQHWPTHKRDCKEFESGCQAMLKNFSGADTHLNGLLVLLKSPVPGETDTWETSFAQVLNMSDRKFSKKNLSRVQMVIR